MTPDPNGFRALHPKTPTKWAILAVSTTQCTLSFKDYEGLLAKLSYRRSKCSLRRALKRCVDFGLLNMIGAKKWKRWRMTARGRDLINTPRTKMIKRNPKLDMIQLKLETADKWTCVSDLVASTNLNPGTIGRLLRSNRHLFKSETIPGDRYRRKQWAHHLKVTTNWDNAVPVKLTFPKKRKQLSLPNPKPYIGGHSMSINSYQGVSMCLSPSAAAKPSLVKAIGDLVTQEFVPAQKKFSAHDVTKRIREVVAQSASTTIDPSETGTVFIKGANKAVPKIVHEDVKDIVHELFHQGLLTGYDRVYNGTFMEYDLTANIAATATPAAVTVVNTTPDPTTTTPAGADGGTYDGSSTI